ncbi:MAG: histidine phosphatase family protein [Promethearchaeota archaeon]|jgi:broad specificity phosphatase PhoE
MRILIARHAEDPGPHYEDQNRDLTATGRKQAEELGQLVVKFKPTHLFCSSLKRSKETAKIVSKHCGLTAVELSLIDEQCSGNKADISNSFRKSRGFVRLEERFEGGETYQELIQRSEKTWKWLRNELTPVNEELRPVLITHGRFMTFLIADILNFPKNGFFLSISNTSYLIIEIPENWRPQIVLPTPRIPYI